MSYIELINIIKKFNNKPVLKDINLDIKEGEFISILGKSGCGKSTTLQLIAGLIQPDSGDILLDDKSILDVTTDKRDVVIVFQDYRLFPHMTVYENVEFGLKIKKVDKKTRRQKVEELLMLVKLDGFENKFPHQLSGGQNQRVAIARSLAVNPKVLLLDEPFSNLDVNLRSDMREFVLDLQKKLKTTMVLVTHDKEEALLMSDRIGVMIDGEIKQYDTPKMLYERPVSKEVANIFGERNYIKGSLDKGKFLSDIVELNLDLDTDESIESVEIMIPVENIVIGDEADNKGSVYNKGRIIKKRYAGGKTYYSVKVEDILFKVNSSEDIYTEGDEVYLYIDNKNIVYFKI